MEEDFRRNKMLEEALRPNNGDCFGYKGAKCFKKRLLGFFNGQTIKCSSELSRTLLEINAVGSRREGREIVNDLENVFLPYKTSKDTLNGDMKITGILFTLIDKEKNKKYKIEKKSYIYNLEENL